MSFYRKYSTSTGTVLVLPEASEAVYSDRARLPENCTCATTSTLVSGTTLLVLLVSVRLWSFNTGTALRKKTVR
jgi:hypothetical protein